MSRRADEAWFLPAQLALAVVALVVLAGLAARAERGADLWLTPDQQGQRAYREKDYETAIERFEDVRWRATAERRAGRYEEAAADYGLGRDAVDLYNRGVVLVRGRAYEEAITAFEAAVAAAPDWAEARENLDVARAIRSYLLTTREASGTEGRLEADELVFDGEAGRGDEMTITDASVLEQASAEKWMRGVDTRTRDFLRIRFLAESARRERQ